MRIGDTIEIPKGTTVYDLSYVPYTPKVSTRKVTGKIVDFHDVNERWQHFITDQEQVALEAEALANGRLARRPWWDGYHHDLPTFKAVYDRIMNMFPAPKLVVWGSYNGAHVNDVNVITKVAKEQTITKRKQMVIGSKWKFTKSVTVDATYCVDGKNLQTVDVYTFPAGLEFTVEAKLTACGHGSGLGIPVGLKFTDITVHVSDPTFLCQPYWNGRILIPYNQVEDAVEAVFIPEVKVFVLKDTITNEYFGDFHLDNTPRMVKTFTSARKYEKPSNAQASIRSWTGQLAGKGSDIEISNGYAIGTDKKMDFPTTWELFEVNPLTFEEKVADLDIQEWYKTL